MMAGRLLQFRDPLSAVVSKLEQRIRNGRLFPVPVLYKKGIFMGKTEQFFLCLAGIIIQVTCRFPECRIFCQDYLCEDSTPKTCMKILVEEQQLCRERAASPGSKDAYLETLIIYREIAERLPNYGRAVFHGAVIQFQGRAYFFSAPSGTGKSTHIALWKKYMGEHVGIVNGDKPILADDGTRILAYGTPWAGKEGWQSNCCAPLCGGVFLRQAKRNRMVRLEPKECAELLMRQLYLPSSPQAAIRTLELADQITRRIPLWILECDMSKEAVQLSFETMTGLDFQKFRIGG